MSNYEFVEMVAAHLRERYDVRLELRKNEVLGTELYGRTSVCNYSRSEKYFKMNFEEEVYDFVNLVLDDSAKMGARYVQRESK